MGSEGPGDDKTRPRVPPAAASAPTVPTQLLAKGDKVGRYVVVRQIGAGGMGVIYLAYDPELDRRVALKLLLPQPGGEDTVSEGRARLIREAHAMAKLNHPNVVAIYDAGTFNDQVFLAMELVEGTTLREWLKAEPRSWREALKVLVAAGRGLAAAHAVGIVHRDFKPANVLIGASGQVKVTDFGIARAERSFVVEVSPGATLAAMDEEGSIDPLATPLTQEGAVSGTPAFMAPEQSVEGGLVDLRVDQFAFCVSAYLALYGQRPYERPFEPEVENPLRQAPKGTRVPAWVRRPLVKGLSFRPDDRYPVMEELLAALEADPALRRRRVAVAVAVAAVVLGSVAAIGVIVQRHRAADACYAPEQKLAGVWTAQDRAKVRAAFLASDVSGAAAIVGFLESKMDDWPVTWVQGYREACRAARVTHTETEGALTLRLDCLDQKREAFQARVDVLRNLDQKTINSAAAIAVGLPMLDECANLRSLSVVTPPPPALAQRVKELRSEAVHAATLDEAGHHKEGRQIAEAAVKDAEALGYAPLTAQAYVSLVGVYLGSSRLAAAVEAGRKVVEIAQVAKLDLIAAREAALLAGDLAVMQTATDAEVEAALAKARELAKRVGDEPSLQATLEGAEASVARRAGHTTDALAHERRNAELRTRLHGSVSTLTPLNNIAYDLDSLGRYDEELAVNQQILETTAQLYGPGNPREMGSWLNIAGMRSDLGNLDGGLEAVKHAIEAGKGDPESDDMVSAFAIEARDLVATRPAEALSILGRALAMQAKLPPGINLNVAFEDRWGCEVYVLAGQPARAIELYGKILAALETMDSKSPNWVDYLRVGGMAYLAAGQPKKAREILERGIALSAAHPFYPGWVAQMRYDLAQALLATHGDRKRAAQLAQAAHDELVKVPLKRALLDEVDAWRAKALRAR